MSGPGPRIDRVASSERSALREALLVYGGALVACLAIAALASVSPFVEEHQQIAVGGLFLIVALEMAHRDPGGPERLGLGLGGLLSPSEAGPGAAAFVRDLARSAWRALPAAAREVAVAIGLALVVFPPFVAGYWLWHRPESGFVFRMPPDAWRFVAAQGIAVALPEEAFFRGYLQTRLTDAFPKTARILRAEISLPALLIQAALFALIHFAFEPFPARLAVFFPALVFGFLRALRGGIGAALVFHAACNVLADLLWRGFA